MVTEALIERCVRKEPKAQLELYRELYSQMMSICSRYERNRQDASARMNQGFLKILENIGTRRSEVPFIPWARRIMINTVIDDFRRSRDRKANENMDAIVEHPAATEVNEYLAHMEAEAFAEMLTRVPPMSRNVFNLFAIDGFAHAEIAAMLGISEGTSKWHVANARGILQNAIARLANQFHANRIAMNERNEFDEIARRKLDERRFAFDEAQWSTVERLLRSGRERSRRIIWLFFLVGLLFTGVATWWALRDGSQASIAENTRTVQVAEQNDAGRGGVTAPVRNEAGTTGSSAATRPSTMQGTSTSGPAAGSIRDNDGTGRDVSQTPSGSVKARRSTTSMANAGVAVNVGVTRHHRLNASIEQAAGSTGEQAQAGADHHGQEPAMKASTAPVGSPASNAQPANGSNGSSILPPEVAVTTGSVAGSAPAIAGSLVIPPEPDGPSTATTANAAADSTSSTAQNPTDTINQQTPKPITLPPVKTSHWELGLLAGGFSTMSQYSGLTSANWGSEVHSASSPGFGAELMKMGPHFGFGTGIHYSSYAEHIHSDELNTTDQVHTTSYYLMPVDTSLMVILGTDTIGGMVHYVTGQLHTTINTLASHTDTTNITTRKREARDLVNTVSYIEIPLLLDAHTRKGHWNFGVRGGPTIGFFSSCSGALPNATLDGYSDLTTGQFNSTVFGYAARIYVRYMLGEAWGIGIEPTMKGQLTSTLVQNDLIRKSNAFGAYLSVTYQLP